MKVFVSWSGELSQKYAKALKEWLEQCIQSVEVFSPLKTLKREKTGKLKYRGNYKIQTTVSFA